MHAINALSIIVDFVPAQNRARRDLQAVFSGRDVLVSTSFPSVCLLGDLI